MGQLDLGQPPWDHEETQFRGQANTLRVAQCGKDERDIVGNTSPEFLNLGTPLSAGFLYEK